MSNTQKRKSKKISKKKSKKSVLIKRKPIIKGTRNIRNKRLLVKNTKKKSKTKNKRKRKYRGGMDDGSAGREKQHSMPEIKSMPWEERLTFINKVGHLELEPEAAKQPIKKADSNPSVGLVENRQQDQSGLAMQKDGHMVDFNMGFTPERLVELFGPDAIARLKAGETLTLDDLYNPTAAAKEREEAEAKAEAMASQLLLEEEEEERRNQSKKQKNKKEKKKKK